MGDESRLIMSMFLSRSRALMTDLLPHADEGGHEGQAYQSVRDAVMAVRGLAEARGCTDDLQLSEGAFKAWLAGSNERINHCNRMLTRSSGRLVLLNLFVAAALGWTCFVGQGAANPSGWARVGEWFAGAAVALSLTCAAIGTWVWQQYRRMPVRLGDDSGSVRTDKILLDHAIEKRIDGVRRWQRAAHWAFMACCLSSCASHSVSLAGKIMRSCAAVAS